MAVGQESWCRPNPGLRQRPLHTLSQAFPPSSTVLSWFDFSLLCLLLGSGSSLMGSKFCHEHCPFDAVLTPDLYWTWTFRWKPTHKDPHSHNRNLIVTAMAVRTSVANVFLSGHTVGTELVTWTDWSTVWLDTVFFWKLTDLCMNLPAPCSFLHVA